MCLSFMLSFMLQGLSYSCLVHLMVIGIVRGQLRLRPPLCILIDSFLPLFASLDGQSEAEAPQEGPSQQEGPGGDSINDHESVIPIPAAPPKRR